MMDSTFKLLSLIVSNCSGSKHKVNIVELQLQMEPINEKIFLKAINELKINYTTVWERIEFNGKNNTKGNE